MIADLVVLEEDYPIFNPIAKTIKQYRAIIARDRGSKGDTQARLKTMATKELAFVWFFANLTSSYNVLTEDEDEREKLLIADLGLPEKWKRDDVINAAIEHYKEYQETPTSGILQTVRRTINKSKKVFTILEGKLDTLLDNLQNADITDDAALASEDKIITLVGKIMDMSSKLTAQLETLDMLEKKYVKELEEKKGKNQSKINPWEL